jgi:guanosine-3',5'-bis(diphosphate) 3'-pyrophosphohydrolase
MSTLERAIAVAAGAHVGQVDKGGQPYILHPLRVMMNVEGEHAKMAAVLHDVVEDTGVTIEDLQVWKFPEPVIKAVIALTRLPGMSRMDAARMAAEDPIALEVKIADLIDNMDLKRIPNPGLRDYDRVAEYNEAWTYLSQEQDKRKAK